MTKQKHYQSAHGAVRSGKQAQRSWLGIITVIVIWPCVIVVVATLCLAAIAGW